MKYEQIVNTKELGFAKIDEMIKGSDTNLQHLKDIDKAQKDKGDLLHQYFELPVADGKAFYQVTKVTEKTATVTICDGICLDEYSDYILGEESTIPLSKAMELVERTTALNKLFSK